MGIALSAVNHYTNDAGTGAETAAAMVTLSKE